MRQFRSDLKALKNEPSEKRRPACVKASEWYGSPILFRKRLTASRSMGGNARGAVASQDSRVKVRRKFGRGGITHVIFSSPPSSFSAEAVRASLDVNRTAPRRSPREWPQASPRKKCSVTVNNGCSRSGCCYVSFLFVFFSC